MNKKTCIVLCMLFSILLGFGFGTLTKEDEKENNHKAYVQKVESNIETSMIFVNLD